MRFTIALACYLISCTALAFEQAGGYYREVIPDGYVVASQCSEMGKFLAKNQSTFPSLTARLNTICDAYKTNHDGDKWLAAYDVILKRVRSTIPNDNLPPTLRRLPEEHWITATGFKTYSLLLFPDATRVDTQEWKSTENSFVRFGQATGPEHLAIWPADDEITPNDTAAHERSETYARKFGLDPRLGPFIVVTQVRPDRWQDGQNLIVLRLGGADAGAVKAILNSLRDEIANDPALKNRSAATTLAFTDVAQHLISFAKANAKYVTVVKSIIL